MTKKKHSRNDSRKSSHAHDVSDILKEKKENIIAWAMEHKQRVLQAGILAIVLIIVLVLVLVFGRNNDGGAAGAETETTEIAVPEEALQKDAYPEVNALIAKYYEALSQGDSAAIEAMDNNVDDTEKIRIEETGQYIESYPLIEVYTKTGPVEGSYLAYVYSKVKFFDFEAEVPGMQSFYVCKAEDGSYYLNEGDVTDEEMDYIMNISLQDDVIDLNNKIAVEYNDMVAADADLNSFLVELNNQILVRVGETLAASETESAETEQPAEETAQETPAEDAEAAENVAKTAKTTTTINVRSSDSETADKLGKLAEGETVPVLETRENGWSKITFEDGEAYVKSEFLTIIAEAESADGVTTNGTVKVVENVNIRSSASETGDKLGLAYQGETLDLIEKQGDGWCKIKYHDQVAYVKSDFVE
ncbi:MAG: SH3 domain-containing protein [Lachnospiraceae bacterium]|nr:SH3 domain-containing protein [Lachnospiraceae bacterium]